MESAGLRRRAAAATKKESDRPGSWIIAGHEPPRFTVDLSVAPEHRYDHIVPHLKGAISDANVAAQFDELVDFILPEMRLAQKCVHGLARIALRRVYGNEETAEIRGIARETGLSMHLLVALNVILDLLLGCTSGGVRHQPDPKSKSPTRILHFRTLDWSMDPLRNLIVELDYIQRPSGPVVATTIGYLGYVGVLTGVRKDLSMSLNFRPHHDTSTLSKRISFRYHQLLVILGRRPSISSTLRSYLLPPSPSPSRSSPTQPALPTIAQILTTLSTSPSTAAYLIFCTPQEIHSVEKDHHSSHLTSSPNFLATCNHDLSDEADPSTLHTIAEHVPAETGMSFLVEDSLERKSQISEKWDELLREKWRGKGKGKRREDGDGERGGVSLDEVLQMVNTGEISNEMTHYAVVMDPREGRVVWRRAYEVGELGGGLSSSEEGETDGDVSGTERL